MAVKFADGSTEHLTPETIGLIRNTVACAVVLFERQQRIRFLDKLLHEQTALTKRRFDDLSELGRELTGALRRATTETRHLSRVSDRIRTVTSDEVAVEVRRVRERFETDLRTTRDEIAELEADWRAVVREFVRQNDLPGSLGRLSVKLDSEGCYEALLRVDNDADMTAMFRLAIPANGSFTRPMCCGDVSGPLKVVVPRRSWLLGDGFAPRRLDSFLITRVIYTGATTLVRLRKRRDQQLGFDLRFARGGDIVIRAVGLGEPRPAEHIAYGDDVAALRQFEHQLLDQVLPFAATREQTLWVRVGGSILWDVTPTEVADSIITAVAGLMRNVRRVLSDERASLAEMVNRLPADVQQHFRPLGLVRGQTLPPPPPRSLLSRGRPRRPTSFGEINRAWERPPSVQ